MSSARQSALPDIIVRIGGLGDRRMMSGHRPWLKYGIAGGKPPWPYIDPAKAVPCAERKTWFALAPDQADAVRLALSSKASVITGG